MRLFRVGVVGGLTGVVVRLWWWHIVCFLDVKFSLGDKWWGSS